MNRQQLRQSLRNKRRALSKTEQQISETQLTAQLAQHTLFLSSQTIAFYVAHEGEMNLASLLQIAWQQKKQCYLPILTDEKQLLFAQHQKQEVLIPNRYQIPEPSLKSATLISPKEIDLVLVPLLAFDSQGNRLGMGAGYYDRTFAFLNHTPRPSKPFLLGIAYEWQRVDQLSAESWDVKLNGICTERGITLCPTG